MNFDVFSVGDLVETTEKIIIRQDGIALRESDEISKEELQGSMVHERGLQCAFMSDYEHDSSYALVAKNIIGQIVLIEKKCLRLITTLDD